MSARVNPTTRKNGKTRILLIDDHAILRQGLAQLINQEPDLSVCGQAEEAPKGFELAGSLKPDVAVVDISLKGGNGLELIKNLKASYPNLPLLVLSMHDESLYAERVLRAGSLGYIMKEEAAESVLVGIRKVLKGEIVLSDKMQARLLHQLVSGGLKKGGSPIDSLSDRELEVFRMIGEGRGTRQIAEDLHLSVRTVEAYREYIKEKLNLKNATELIQHAFQWVHSGALP
ncbi:MAG: response regulator transcription factor [Verrucomicrobia bacterium]|nr:response regulator transcription factor [Verrucomicrobiota bacterium]